MDGDAKGERQFDLHMHTRHSRDSRTSVNEILRIAELRGYGIAITDHNEIAGSLEALKQKKVEVLPGIEVTSSEGIDFLCYFPTEKALVEFFRTEIEYKRRNNLIRTTKLSGDSIIQACHHHGGVVALAHPYRYIMRLYDAFLTLPRIERFLPLVDMVETINGKTPQRLNRKAERKARSLGKPMIGGSDAHVGGDLFVASTRISGPVFEALKKGNSQPTGKGEKSLQKIARGIRDAIFK